jgi:hypothetical protein
MAGKTFSGIGVDDLDKIIPPVGRDGAADAAPMRDGAADAAPVPRPEGEEGDDIRGVYSGPTVVDDDKVAEGLKRLRSLERSTAVGTGPPVLAPPDPAGEVSELVADMDSSEPTKIGMPHQRPTAVGHSVGDDAPGQQQPVGQIDNLRGTMFGHMVHLPDIPIDTDEPSGPAAAPVYTPPKPAATQQLVRYQPPSVPSMHGYPQAKSFHRSPFPSNEPDLRTETIPPLERKASARVLVMVLGMAVLGAGAALAFRYYRTADAAASAPSPAEIAGPPPATGLQAAAPPTNPGAAAAANPGAAAAANPGAAAAANPTAAPANPTAAPANPAEVPPANPAAARPGAEPAAPSVAEAPPPPAPKPSPASDPPLPRASAGESAAIAPPPAAPEGDGRPRRRGGHADKRRAPAAAAAAAGPAPTDEAPAATPKPPRKKALDEDPDATLPPSTTE